MVAGGAEATVSAARASAASARARALSTRNDDPGHRQPALGRDRDGFVLGEGAGILVLEELEHAKARGARIYCELAGYGMSADAHHITAPPEDGDGACRSMLNALRNAGMTPGRHRVHQCARHLHAAGGRRRVHRGQARLR